MALDLEYLRQVGLLADALHHVLEELWLGQWVLVVHGQVVQKLVFGRVRCLIVEESESSNQVVLSLICVWVHTDVAMSGLGKEARWQLQSHPVGGTKHGTDHWVAHPLLAKHSIGGLHLTLNWHPFVGSKSAHSKAKELLDLLDTHDLVDLLSVGVVVAIGGLDALDGVLAGSLRRIGNVAKLALSLKLALHLVLNVFIINL